MSKLKTRASVTTSTVTKEKHKEVPKGATIKSQTIRTETEEIENGFLISKNYDINYEHDGESGYAYYTKKWYSKNDPLTITVEDKALADLIED